MMGVYFTTVSTVSFKTTPSSCSQQCAENGSATTPNTQVGNME